MKIVHEADVPFEQRQHQPRDGKFEFRRLLEGTAGDPGNFLLQLVRTYGDFFSPRHMHNFDQVRFQIEGSFDFARDGKMVPGTIAYFPEGTSYGPQSSSDDSLVLVLQFGGASGSGYMSEDELTRNIRELKKTGEFSKGVYTRITPDGRKINQDGYEAVWEHHNGRRLVYPDQRYQKPVFMNPESFSWIAARDGEAAWRKPLGTFSERLTKLAFLRLETGGRIALTGSSILFVVAGAGRHGDQSWETHATFHLDRGESAEIEATADSVILEIGLPDLRELARADPPEVALAS